VHGCRSSSSCTVVRLGRAKGAVVFIKMVHGGSTVCAWTPCYPRLAGGLGDSTAHRRSGPLHVSAHPSPSVKARQHVVALEPRYGWRPWSVNACAPTHWLTRNGRLGLCCAATGTIVPASRWSTQPAALPAVSRGRHGVVARPARPAHHHESRPSCTRSSQDARPGAGGSASLAVGLCSQ
jgi:hypothetical protein